MNPFLILQSAFRSLHRHKMRSLLTTLGIIIGVVAIISVMSIGEGAKHKVGQTIAKMGSNFIIAAAAPPKAIMQRGAVYYTLKPSDIRAIKNECDDIHLISPGIQYQGKIVYNGNNWHTTVFGVNEDYLEIREMGTTSGEYFTAQDVRSGRKVAVIGQSIVNELFDGNDPVEATIRIKKIPFKVLGVLEETGRSPDGRDMDDIIFVPVTTAQRKLVGKDNYNALIMTAISKDRMNVAARQVRSILRQQHRLKEWDDDDFSLFTQDDISQATDSAFAILNLLLFIISAISLIVGGIGIMNIMLVTVTERTKEIGIRMALGATTSNILNQFILEAITVCLIGGLIGVVLGIGTAQVVGLGLGWPIFISKQSILLSLGSSVLIGLFFGYYPAYKASRLDPVEALLEH